MSAESVGHRETVGPHLEASPRNDRRSFQKIVELHRKELLAHCYRFTGSTHDADDLVQETFLRAWRGIERFEGRSSLRSWLYRIATNVCLNAIEQKASAKRVFPQDVTASTSRMPDGRPQLDLPWIEPMPDAWMENMADLSPGPAARYEQRETIRLAFIAATQRLPARQRAVLLLRDVLGWSASETAGTLKMSVPAVNSALQRARSTLGEGFSPEGMNDAAASEGSDQSLANHYADAWERSDLKGLVALLAKDATLVMPPLSEWYSGRTAIRRFFDWAFDWAWTAYQTGAFRMITTHANGQIAFGHYVRRAGEAKFHAHALQVLSLRRKKIGQLTVFVGPHYFKAFGLAATLDPEI